MKPKSQQPIHASLNSLKLIVFYCKEDYSIARQAANQEDLPLRECFDNQEAAKLCRLIYYHSQNDLVIPLGAFNVHTICFELHDLLRRQSSCDTYIHVKFLWQRTWPI
jgi:hypothetical protein